VKGLTIFSWGYWGWGNSTCQLVQAVDAVEESRGFLPPVFVDIRISRSVRAVGFNGSAFAELLGDDRYRWMKSLGNARILSREGPAIQIAEPKAADELLDLASALAKQKRRLLFFCSCQWPKCDGKVNCHRATVASLLLKAANKKGADIEVVEWPGGETGELVVPVSPETYRAVAKGRMTIPLGRKVDLAGLARLPWASVVALESSGETLYRVVGPAFWQKDQWSLPVLYCFFDPATPRAKYDKEAEKLGKSLGLDARYA